MDKKGVRVAAVTWLLFVGLYLLFSGKADPVEAAAGGIAAGLALWLVRMLRDSFLSPLRVKPGWLLLLRHIPVAMLTESWLLLLALLRQLTGRGAQGTLLEHPYPLPQDRHAAARPAWTTFGVCITPNSYLVFVDHDRKEVVIRQLVGRELSAVDRIFVELS